MNIIEIRDSVFLLNTLHTSYLYFLRRNLATKLYIHDLTIDEVSITWDTKSILGGS